MRRRAFTNVQTFGGHAAVADAEVPAEQAAMSAGLATPVKVLKAGQHGSNSSSSLAFFQAFRPQVSVISAGRTNVYGHPAAETIARPGSVGSLFEYATGCRSSSQPTAREMIARKSAGVWIGRSPATPSRWPSPVTSGAPCSAASASR